MEALIFYGLSDRALTLITYSYLGAAEHSPVPPQNTVDEHLKEIIEDD